MRRIAQPWSSFQNSPPARHTYVHHRRSTILLDRVQTIRDHNLGQTDLHDEPRETCTDGVNVTHRCMEMGHCTCSKKNALPNKKNKQYTDLRMFPFAFLPRSHVCKTLDSAARRVPWQVSATSSDLTLFRRKRTLKELCTRQLLREQLHPHEHVERQARKTCFIRASSPPIWTVSVIVTLAFSPRAWP